MYRLGKIFAFAILVLLYFKCSFANDIFSVAVTENVWSKNLITSKQKAIQLAKKDAFQILMARMLNSRDMRTISNTTSDPFVKEIGINNENLEQNNYNANFSVHFFPQKIRNFLLQKNIPFAETQGPLMVIVLRDHGHILWPMGLKSVFSTFNVDSSNTLLPLLVIPGVQSDIDNITILTLTSSSALSYVETKYHAGGIIILDILSQNSVSASFLGIWNPGVIKAENIPALIFQIQEIWKKSVMHNGQEEKYCFEVQASHLIDWTNIKKRLMRINALRDLNIFNIQIGAVQANAMFSGTALQLQLALAGQGIFAQYQIKNKCWLLQNLPFFNNIKG